VSGDRGRPRASRAGDAHLQPGARLPRRTLLRGLAAAAALATAALPRTFAAAAAPAPAPPSGLRKPGTLSVAVYQDMPPFHAAGRGIDVDLAHALAQALGLHLSLLPFPAGDDVADDLRNMVWKGHYLGYGPADALLHVPVDAPLMAANPQVRILAPYWRERVVIARRIDRVPELDSLAPLVGQPVAVAGQTLAGWLLLGAEGGALRARLSTHWPDGTAAAQALQRDEVAACAGLASELESVLAGDARFAITPLPVPQGARSAWAVGLAVRQDADELAPALQSAMAGLADSGRLAEIFAQAHLRWRPV
jgi:ABC-type amino acid transport substrate-binding protein